MWDQRCKFADVGKTTCSVEISAALAKHYGKKTLLIDLDPQASATFYVMEQAFWHKWKETRGSTYNIFEQRSSSFPIKNAIVPDVVASKTPVFGFDLLPSNPDLVDVDLRIADFVGYNILQRLVPTSAKKADLVSKILAKQEHRHSEQFAIQNM